MCFLYQTAGSHYLYHYSTHILFGYHRVRCTDVTLRHLDNALRQHRWIIHMGSTYGILILCGDTHGILCTGQIQCVVGHCCTGVIVMLTWYVMLFSAKGKWHSSCPDCGGVQCYIQYNHWNSANWELVGGTLFWV